MNQNNIQFSTNEVFQIPVKNQKIENKEENKIENTSKQSKINEKAKKQEKSLDSMLIPKILPKRDSAEQFVSAFVQEKSQTIEEDRHKKQMFNKKVPRSYC